jgi:cation-transporting ATPase 13A2
VASFTFYQDEDEALGDDQRFESIQDVDDEDAISIETEDPVIRDDYILRRRSSTYSHLSAATGLLRHSSATSANPERLPPKVSQKAYLVDEDLTIAIAGFRTHAVGYAAYIALCVLTCGLAWLLLRWLPGWYVRLVGETTALGKSDWVVIEVCKPQISIQEDFC